jgi:hypothetical protein
MIRRRTMETKDIGNGDKEPYRASRAERGGRRRWFWCGLALSSIVLAACAAQVGRGEELKERVELSVLTPDAGWEFRVREVRETPTEVWVWAELQRRDGMAAQVITTVTTTVELPANKTRRVFVTGKTWGWENDEPYEFVTEQPPWPSDAGTPQAGAESPATR